jgi:hypothetical protein
VTLESEIKKRAQKWATEITNKAKTNLGNKARLIRVQSKTTSVSNGIVTIEVIGSNKTSNKWGVVNVARAYEQGSGIHGRRKRTYVIKPRKAKGLLVFEWDVMNNVMELDGIEAVRESLQYTGKFVGFSKETAESGFPKYLFRYVDHPGVQAVNNGAGYIRPAVKNVRGKINRELRKMGGDEYRASIRKAFKQ